LEIPSPYAQTINFECPPLFPGFTAFLFANVTTFSDGLIKFFDKVVVSHFAVHEGLQPFKQVVLVCMVSGSEDVGFAAEWIFGI
jgi:hypothetical protein